MPRNACGSPAQYSLERPARAADDLQAREVVRRAGTRSPSRGRRSSRSTPSTSTIPVRRHRRDRLRDELDVGLLERGVEGRGEDRPLARVRVRRGDGLAQVGAVLEAPGRCSRGRTGVRTAFSFVSTRKILPPQMFFSSSHFSRRRSCRRRHGFENVLRSSAVKSRSPLGMTQPGSRWNR